MIFSWFKARRRDKLLIDPFPDEWLPHVSRYLPTNTGYLNGKRQ